MTHQSEQQLEKTLIEQLGRLGFSYIVIEDTVAMVANLRGQLKNSIRQNFPMMNLLAS